MTNAVEVEAEVIEEGALAIDVKGINVSLEGLQQRALAINDAIAEAAKAAGELEAGDDVISGMALDDVKRGEQALSRCITAAEDARKAFNGDYDTPKKRIASAYQEAMEGVKSLHERYKARRLAAEDEIKAAHYQALEDAYQDFMAGNGLGELAEAVPLERFAERKWWDSVAKNFSEKGAADKMIKRATEIVADWNALKSGQYHFPTQAQATFFRTLSLREVAEQDALAYEEALRVEAVNAEVQANAGYAESYYEPVPVYEPESPIPDIVAEAEAVVAQVPQIRTYVICADLTPEQYAGLIDYFRSVGAHGIPLATPFDGWQQASEAVKEACRG
ncbi:MAG: hypothetical protein HFJ75_07575 [Eggerthellaceae bacterium]|nr:hypothetical protein [Eggerthellaceae bacterium]